jgi:pimeloyl-ACP methyl ester carboxylesterase
MRRLVRLLAVGIAVAGTGCAGPGRPEPLVKDFGIGHLLHPLEEPEQIRYPPGCAGRCHKEHVYVFAINGLNPLCLGNFNGLCCYLRQQGFEHTYFAQAYTSFWFPDEIREVRERDPEAKIVLLGFSWGANCVRSLAHRLDEDGIPVDLMVYLVGDTIWRIVNIRGRGLILLGGVCDGADIDGARNEHLDCRHILAPSRRETLEIVTEELLALSCSPAAK